ncbi:MAG: VCBS repeat-containing protein [Thermoplasmata archaeon]|nr:VCBS repeat-containing protein [Thermoplasmata archaeon]
MTKTITGILIVPAVLLLISATILPLIFSSSSTFFSASYGEDTNREVCKTHREILSDLSKPFFKKPKLIAETGIENWRLAIGDIDGDGDLDIVTSWNGPPEYPEIGIRGISILLNHGNGTFVEKVLNFTIDHHIDDIDSADYDGDGDLDIIFTYDESMNYIATNGTVNIMWNDGKGNFSKPEQILWFGPGDPYNPDNNRINIEVGSADFDKDGDIDILVGSNTGWVRLYKNDGTGHNFTLTKAIYDYGNLSWEIAPADFNNDGWIDFVVCSDSGLYLKFNNHSPECFDYGPGICLLNLSNLPFGFELSPTPLPGTIAPIDYNRDGQEDFIFAFLHIIYLFMNNNLNFTSVCVSYSFDPANFRGGGITVADLDSDGWEDMIIGSGGGKIYLLSNNKTFVSIASPIDKTIYFKGRFVYSLSPEWWGKCVIIGNITFKAVPLEPLDRVEFYVDGQLVENDTTPPYEWTWNIRNFLPKWYNVDAVAYIQNGEYGGRYRLEVLKIL